MINVKELMIGDYVDVSRHGNPIELDIIQEVSDVGSETTIGLEKCSGIFAGNEISPIALTEELFLKNGFKELCRTEYSTRLYNSDLYLRVTITRENRFTCNQIGVNYVHEFQHYLRMIGLSEMANNLKL